MPRQTLSTLVEKVDPQWAALMVIDMQNDFVSPDGAFHRTGADITMAQKGLPKLVNLIDSPPLSQIVRVHKSTPHAAAVVCQVATTSFEYAAWP